LQAVDVRAAAREDVRVFCADDAIAEDAHGGIFARHDMVMPGPFRENMGRTSRRTDLEVNVGDFKIISADSHINEPPDLWTSRVPAKFKDRAPRMQRFPEGDAWVLEGALDPINFGSNWNAGVPIDERTPWSLWEDVRHGGYVPSARLEEQDQDGVSAEVLYPTPRIQNQLAWHTVDPEFHVACFRAYNDWISEYAGYAPDRLWGVAYIPNVGADIAIAELHRVLELPGIRGVLIGSVARGRLEIADADDRSSPRSAEAGVPLSIHVGFATAAQGDKARGKMRGDMRFFDAPIRVAQLMSSGRSIATTDLKVALVEVDAGWVPYLKEQMDDRHSRSKIRTRPHRACISNATSRMCSSPTATASRIVTRSVSTACCGPATSLTVAPTGRIRARRSSVSSRGARRRALSHPAGNALRLYGVHAGANA
jgi:hypothetical protein